jgi:DNA recombination protein RmuC
VNEFILSVGVLGLVVTALTLVRVIRAQAHLAAAALALNNRIGDSLEQLTSLGREAAQSGRDSKDGVARLLTDLGDLRGRTTSVVDSQAKLATAVTHLDSTLPLQMASGVNSLTEALTAGQTAIRVEAADRATRDAQALSSKLTEAFVTLSDQVARMRSETASTLRESGESLGRRMEELRGSTDAKLNQIVVRTTDSSKALNETAQKSVTSVTDRLAELKATVDASLREELGAIRRESGSKLDEMRRTVDEKLHATLEQRLGDSFKIVSDRLELVHRGLGEMQSLATGVGDLKKVLTNVRTRGTWGEVQLESLLDQVLTHEQYGKNVATKQGSTARVEFAIRLPGREEGESVWLPIDAKFPMESYQRLVDAQEQGDVAACEEASKALEGRIKSEAKTIRDKYIDPPHTTDFAILYLPTEGLYAEVMRRRGLSEWLQRECKISPTGPTNLAALLNSLQMGFRTLAIERRSSEVWGLLGAVKTEFSRFGDALAHTRKKLEEAHSSLESTEQRNRVLTRKLRGVDALPPPAAAMVLEQGGNIEATDESLLEG